MRADGDVQRRSWPVQLGLCLVILFLALVGRDVGGGWWEFATPCLLVVCAIVMLVRGGPGERLLVASVGLPILVVLCIGVVLALMV